MPICAPPNRVLGVKVGETEFFFVILSLWECNIQGLTLYESNCVKIGFVVLARGVSKILGRKKNKNHARVIFHPFAHPPPVGRSLSFLGEVISPTELP